MKLLTSNVLPPSITSTLYQMQTITVGGTVYMNDNEMYIIQDRGVLTPGCLAFVIMNGHLDLTEWISVVQLIRIDFQFQHHYSLTVSI